MMTYTIPPVAKPNRAHACIHGLRFTAPETALIRPGLCTCTASLYAWRGLRPQANFECDQVHRDSFFEISTTPKCQKSLKCLVVNWIVAVLQRTAVWRAAAIRNARVAFLVSGGA